MPNHFSSLRALSFLLINGLVVALLTACGGGGDDGGANAAPAAPTARIDADNAEAVMAATLSSTEFVRSSSQFGLSSDAPVFAASLTSPGNVVLDDFRLTTFLRRHTVAALADAAQSGAQIQKAVETISEPCTDGGTVTVSFNDQDNDQAPSVGDSMTLSFSNCAEFGETANGSLSVDITELSGDIVNGIGPWRFAMVVTLDNLSISSDTGTGTIAGQMTVAISGNADVEARAELSIDTLTAEDSSGNAVRMDNISIVVLGDANIQEDSVTINGTITISDYGVVTLTTIEPLRQRAMDLYPYAGSIRLTGADNTSVMLTVIDEVRVRLDVDADGDGIAETMIETTWQVLEEA